MDTVFGRFVHPQILPYYEEVEVDVADGGTRRVAVVTVLAGTAKPYVVRHNDREDVYVRMGSTSRFATREQQARLFASGGLLHAELLPVSGSGFGDFDKARLSDHLVRFAGDETLPNDQTAWEHRLETLGFMAHRPDGPAICTVAGLLLFGRTPRRLLRQAGIRFMAFQGPEKEYQALEDAILDGPLVALFAPTPGGGAKRLEPGLLETLDAHLRPRVSHETADIVDGFRRERRWTYPPEAIREAVLNALIHRDWTRALEVEVVVYGDRLEVTSPGPLPNSMTVDKMLGGQRSPRNPILVDVMRDYGYVDARGMGVRRKIVPLVRQASGRDAVFEATEDLLRVVLPGAGGE